VLLSGPLSDRLGRRKVLAFATLFSAGLALLFQNLSGWLAVPVLLILGFFALSTLPVMMAIVQENFPEQRATANGIYMMLSFVLRTIGAVVVGFLGDRFGLSTAFTISALVSLLAIPAILALPGRKKMHLGS
jgi:FSR family fosmidomycin resistance protein-like MFS transporter